MPKSTIARCAATLTNLIFLACALALLATTLFAAFNAPKPVVSPERVSVYPQYIITLLLVGCYAAALSILSLLGLVSLCFLNSFLLFLYILGQAAMIGALLISIAFTLTVRKRLHYKLEESWRGKPTCLEGETCTPVETFRRSESILIFCLLGFLVLQIIHICTCWYLCERRSNQEKYKLQLQRADEDDE
ncbi:unnamed protein product [Caenorhabditis bovis]|uniref:Uncharacterized protein n=1 Tax=Caenorhabditis bovis TaxID=2654633 RepID=A0A8S1F179_9PELO|nr:unnamed protein product [Caenorhabditis bovis]